MRSLVDVAEPAAAGLVQGSLADLFEQLFDHRPDAHDFCGSLNGLDDAFFGVGVGRLGRLSSRRVDHFGFEGWAADRGAVDLAAPVVAAAVARLGGSDTHGPVPSRARRGTCISSAVREP